MASTVARGRSCLFTQVDFGAGLDQTLAGRSAYSLLEAMLVALTIMRLTY
jgi:hypothetical protein